MSWPYWLVLSIGILIAALVLRKLSAIADHLYGIHGILNAVHADALERFRENRRFATRD